jgi:hypothetical protein
MLWSESRWQWELLAILGFTGFCNLTFEVYYQTNGKPLATNSVWNSPQCLSKPTETWMILIIFLFMPKLSVFLIHCEGRTLKLLSCRNIIFLRVLSLFAVTQVDLLRRVSLCTYVSQGRAASVFSFSLIYDNFSINFVWTSVLLIWTYFLILTYFCISLHFFLWSFLCFPLTFVRCLEVE